MAKVNSGDIFISRLEDGRYIAVRVLRKVDRSCLINTTPYLGTERPSLTDPVLRNSLPQHRFRYEGELTREWVQGIPPANFEFLGNIPVTAAEAATECNIFGGRWHEGTGREVWWEWRWTYDRAAFEEEIRGEQEASLRADATRSQKPKRMMKEDDFWSIITLVNWERHDDDDEAVIAPAVQALSERPKADINRFEERMAFLLYQLDTREHARNIGDDAYVNGDEFFSVDGFLYARCAVVANGKEFYEMVLNDPTQMPKNTEFEPLMWIASTAYELKTGNEFEYVTGCSYETFSNLAGWEGNA